METRYLWIQEELKGQRLKLTKVKGTKNATDVATKHVVDWSDQSNQVSSSSAQSVT